MLTERYAEPFLGTHLLPREHWKPFPTSSNRVAWEALPCELRKGLTEAADSAMTRDWPALPASIYLDFARTGTRAQFEALCGPRRSILAQLVLGECVEGRGRFLDAIADAAWSLCEESSWCIPAHVGCQKAGVGLPDTTEPIVDLFAAETGALLAWTVYLVGNVLDTVSPLVRTRIVREIRERILGPCLERDDFWWMGFLANRSLNNWTPWINSNWLTCALLTEEDPEQRLTAVTRSMRSIDQFLEPYPRDGGCDEGPGYWGRAGASLYDCLELLHSATDGHVDVFDDPLVANMGRFIYRDHIHNDWFVNFADAAALSVPPGGVVFGYGKRIGDPDMAGFGAHLVARAGMATSRGMSCLGRSLPLLFSWQEIADTPPRQPLPRDVWLPDLQVMVARSRQGSAEGFFVAAKGGHNAESHNHNDIGNVIVFRNGAPLLIDVGVETYRRETFSGERYTIWTMQSAFHNLPTVNGFDQRPGVDAAARSVVYNADDETAALELDIAGAYPADAGITSWVRRVALHRTDTVEVEDRYEMDKPLDHLTFSWMTPCPARALPDGCVRLDQRELPKGLHTASGALRYDPSRLNAVVETVPVTDGRLGSVWGDTLYRILLTPRALDNVGSYAVRVKGA